MKAVSTKPSLISDGGGGTVYEIAHAKKQKWATYMPGLKSSGRGSVENFTNCFNEGVKFGHRHTSSTAAVSSGSLMGIFNIMTTSMVYFTMAVHSIHQAGVAVKGATEIILVLRCDLM